MSYPPPRFEVVDGLTRGFWYWVFPDTPFLCNGAGFANQYVDPGVLLPVGIVAPIWINQATARVWGCQQLNGGWVSMQVAKKISDTPPTWDSTGPEVVVAFDGLIQQCTPHPGKGMPANPTDRLLVEAGAVNYGSLPQPPNPNPIFGNTLQRIWAIGLWYTVGA